MKKYKIIKERTSDYPNPIELKKNETVIVGEEYFGNKDWVNWIKCTNHKNITGWVPKQILKIEKDTAVVLEDYSANELNINIDEEVEIIKTINGWAWSRKSKNEIGWIPLESIEK